MNFFQGDNMVNKYKLEENEFVFGGCVNDGIKMPYKEGF